MHQHTSSGLGLRPDDGRHAGQVAGDVLCVRVLQGQLEAVLHQGEAGQLLRHVDHEAGLEAGHGHGRQSSGGAEVQVGCDLSYLQFNVTLKQSFYSPLVDREHVHSELGHLFNMQNLSEVPSAFPAY